MTISRIPATANPLRVLSTMGLPPKRRSGLGLFSVKGQSLTPRPAAKTTAFITDSDPSALAEWRAPFLSLFSPRPQFVLPRMSHVQRVRCHSDELEPTRLAN